VERYQGEALPRHGRIAVVANDALGNYVVTTPLIQMLRAKFPEATLDYFGGTRTEELRKREPMIDGGFPIHGSPPYAAAHAVAQGYHLVVNVESSEWARAFAAVASGPDGMIVGPAISADGRGEMPFANDDRGALQADPDWTAPDLRQRFPFLDSSFIGEIFCRLAYLEGPMPRYRLPQDPCGREIPDVLIATAASLPEKLWPAEKWRETVGALRDRGLRVGLLGAKPSAQAKFWQGNETEEGLVRDGLVEDLRGAFSLPQVVDALATAKQVVTLDNGILHLAAATQTPTVGLFRHGIHRLWAPPAPNVTVLTPGEDLDVAVIAPTDVLEAVRAG